MSTTCRSVRWRCRRAGGDDPSVARSRRRPAVRRPGPAGRSDLRARRRHRARPWPRSSAAWRACRWPSSWSPPASARCRRRVLVRRLDSTLDLRGPDVDLPDRQRTLRATVVWSHDLLDEPERALLARLSVCLGGATLDTAEAVGAVDGDLDVPEVLSSLVGPQPGDAHRHRGGRAALPHARGGAHLRRGTAARARRGDRHPGTAGPATSPSVSAAAGIGLSGPDRRPLAGPPGRRDGRSAGGRALGRGHRPRRTRGRARRAARPLVVVPAGC